MAERDPEREALHKLRKFTGWYSHGLPGGRDLRRQINDLPDVETFLAAVEGFFDRLEARPAKALKRLRERGSAIRQLPAHRRHGESARRRGAMSDRRTIERLIFVFDADSGALSAFFDSAKKALRLGGCALCTITHGLAGERSEWRECKEELGVPVEYVHRDEIGPELREALRGEAAGGDGRGRRAANPAHGSRRARALPRQRGGPARPDGLLREHPRPGPPHRRRAEAAS